LSHPTPHEAFGAEKTRNKANNMAEKKSIAEKKTQHEQEW